MTLTGSLDQTRQRANLAFIASGAEFAFGATAGRR